MTLRDITNAELISHIRRAGSIWFKNSDLLILEEIIRRWNSAEDILSKLENEPAHATEENIPDDQSR